MTRAARSLAPLPLVLTRLLDGIGPVVPLRLAPEAARGAVLAEALTAPGPVPDRALARRAGWAVASHDTVGASGYTPAYPALTPVPVEAGAPLPPGTDAVLEPGDVAREGTLPEVLAVAGPGEGARRPGEDAPAGAVLREAGERVRALDVGLARALGHETLEVRRPRVALWTGEAGPATAYIAGALARAAQARAVSELPDDADLVVGVGWDVLAAGIAALSDRGTLVAHGIAIAPGGETACGVAGGAPVILLPGRLEEAFAGLHLLVRPVLERLSGARPRRPDLVAPLSGKLASAVGFAEMALLALEEGRLRPLAVGDLAWSALAGAAAWTLVPPEAEGYPAGARIPAFALDIAPPDPCP
jgi:molybdopterin biosynthesis enzyme